MALPPFAHPMRQNRRDPGPHVDAAEQAAAAERFSEPHYLFILGLRQHR